MQVTIDIPEPLYLDLQSQAREEHTSVEETLLKRADIHGTHLHVCGQALSVNEGELGVLIRMGINLNDIALMSNDEWDGLEQALAIDPEVAVKEFGLRRLNDPA